MPVNTENINDRFFEGSYKDAWKKTIPEGLSEAEVDFIIDIGSLKAGSKVIDLMCGWGRHSIELARRGITVTAIDNLKDYVEEIKLKALQEGLNIQTVHRSVLDITLEGEYKAAICMGNSFNFFDRDDALSILKNVSSHLSPKGVLVINSWSIAEIAIRYFKEKDWYWAGDYRCVIDYKYALHPSRIESEQAIIASDGTSETLTAVDYIYSLEELEHLFRAAGLRTKVLYSTPRKKPFSFGDVRVYIVAEKIH
ncbi:MAG TPA: class I SAM-dependent methyltransferase [Flavisolibacter sp.]|nr:class I SAM-dependent methyltransferase [Flavisolibacter sp.]